ncbi:MAG: hypothetical protein SFY80_08635 [Verrucomicrobiota bacterium]|nr:hypothetical protein [Verrucomicrobiota bacterium]
MNYELTSCHFIQKHTVVLFVGPPGVRKTHWRKPSAMRLLNKACT